MTINTKIDDSSINYFYIHNILFCFFDICTFSWLIVNKITVIPNGCRNCERNQQASIKSKIKLIEIPIV